MQKRLSVLILLGLVFLAVPMTVTALGLDVEAKAGAGVGLGTTDNTDITGVARLAAGGGISVDLYLLSLGPVDIGLSTGVEYSYLTFHSTWANKVALPPSDMTTDSIYNYLNLPISLVGSMPINPSIKLVVRAGGFIGYFLSGTYKNTFSNPFIPSNSGSFDSDSANRWEYGLHFTAGADLALGGSLWVEPALQFDMGLTDTTPNNATNGHFNDTFWSLTMVLGIKYKVM
jgi:hypothetical protein